MRCHFHNYTGKIMMTHMIIQEDGEKASRVLSMGMWAGAASWDNGLTDSPIFLKPVPFERAKPLLGATLELWLHAHLCLFSRSAGNPHRRCCSWQWGEGETQLPLDSFLTAARTDYRKPSDLQQHGFIASQIWRSGGLPSRFQQGWALLEALGDNPFPWFPRF